MYFYVKGKQSLALIVYTKFMTNYQTHDRSDPAAFDLVLTLQKALVGSHVNITHAFPLISFYT